MTAAGADPFWDWSVRAWRDADVEALCLELQDRHDVFVPALLFAFWSTSTGHPLPDNFSRRLRLADWHTRVLSPLRVLRRSQAGRHGRESSGYTQLRQLELRLERMLMARMHGQVSREPVPVGAAGQALLAQNLAATLGEIPDAAQSSLDALTARLLPSG